MNVKLKVLTAGVLFFTGQALSAQEVKTDTLPQEEKEIEVLTVVAYGRQKKEAITGSVGQVKADDLKASSAPNAVQGVIGKIAGVQISNNNGLPGQAPTVRFRGIGSINGSSRPLYVVDNVPFNGDIAAINSADIESMSFLKDASAAALYGSRGANGVIIITTKQGKRGKTRYNLDIKAGIAQRGVPEYSLVQSPQEYYEAYHRMLKNGYIASGNTETVAHTQASNNLISGGNGLSYNITNVANNLIIGADGKFNPNASILYQEDWADRLFKNGFFTNTYFSGSGGDGRTNHFFSIGYESNDTYVVNSKFERVTARLKVDTRAGERWKFGGNLAYTHMIQNAPDGYDGSTIASNPFGWTRTIAPIYPVYAYDSNGNPIYLSNGSRAYDDGRGTYNNGISRPYGGMQNPYATAIYDIKKNKTNQIFGSAYATFNILKGLDFTYNLTGEYRGYNSTSLDTALYGDALGVNGRLTRENSETFSITNQQLLTYETRLGGLGLQAMVGHESMKYEYEYLSASAMNGRLVSSPYLNQYGIVTGINNFGVPYSTEGFFGRLNLDYANKYFINLNARRDGSSRFHPDNRWGNFFGIGGAWVVSRENFLANSSWLNNLRLKVSYGQQGNDDLASGSTVAMRTQFATPYLDLYKITHTFDSSNTTISLDPQFKGNKDITWEKNSNFNVGFDLDLFDRWHIEAEYFNRKSKDMLFMRPLPLSKGFVSQPENIGDMINRGFEITTGVDIIRNDNLSLNFNLNGTFLKNEIKKLAEAEIVDRNYLLKPGNTRYTWRMREFVGVNPTNGAALFTYINPATGAVSTTENYNDATLVDTGKSAVPKFYGGFGFDMKYKNFDFGINFAYQLGGWGYDNAWISSLGGSVGENFHTDYAGTWSYNNTSAKLPIVLPSNSKDYYSRSTLGLIKSDYLSLQSISLGYTIDRDLLNVAGINGIRVYATADNVYLWSRRKGYDPRQDISGISYNTFSPIRTIAVGFNISF